MASAGAQAALRGYRLQALYTLYRILESEDLSFQPEGSEDLDVLGTNGELIEIIQVKAHEGNLTLSSLSPHKAESFLRRALARRKTHPCAREKIVSFGPIGPDMARAWTTDGPERRDALHYLQTCKYTASEAGAVISTIQIEQVDADRIEAEVLAKLRESLVGVDARAAFDLLHAWLFWASENKQRITRRALIDKIDAIGSFIAARTAHHEEWYRSIVPLEELAHPADPEELAAEFYKGVAARYDHIAAGVDIERTDRLSELHQALAEARLVIVHGASGQGKSALAYRYLRDYVPEGWRFEIRRIENRLHALGIARALFGHLDAIGAPAWVYIDVAPGDAAWIDLVRELARIPRIRLLITIREEDWKRTTVSGPFMERREVELRFDGAEARRMYARLAQRRAPSHLLDFEDAWARFGGSGPLLEFAYFVVQNETLEARLAAQVRRLRDEVRSGSRSREELDLLRRVAVVTAYGARLDLTALVRGLNLAEPRRTVEVYEREYLLRVGGDGRLVEGLHPIRSEMLARLLTDEVLEPWSDAAVASLPAIVEEDVEGFLLHAFSRRYEGSEPLLAALSTFMPRTWAGLAGVTRALLWLGAKRYLLQNEALIRELYAQHGESWSLMLMADIGNLDAIAPGLMKPIFEYLDFIPEEARREMAAYRERLTPRDTVLDHVRVWLKTRDVPPAPPTSHYDWLGAAEVSFWVSHLGLGTKLIFPIDEHMSRPTADAVPLEVLARVAYAVSFSKDRKVQRKLTQVRPKLLERFQQETLTPHIEDDGRTIRAHFLLDLAALEETEVARRAKGAKSKNMLHAEAMRRVELLRQIVPDREAYGCQGYGHRSELLPMDHDPTTKAGIEVRHLVPSWPKRVNISFTRLGDNLFRPDNWEAHARAVLDIRRRNIEALKQLVDCLGVFFRKKGPVEIVGALLAAERWHATKDKIGRRPPLPRDIVDEWGQVAEAEPSDERSPQRGIVELGLALERHEPYREAFRTFTSSLSNFYNQAIPALKCLPLLRTGKIPGTIRDEVGRLPTINLAEAVSVLPAFQREFRERFSGLLGAREVDALDRLELDVARRTFAAWHQFVRHAERTIQHGIVEATRKLETALDDIRRKLKAKLKALKFASGRLAASIRAEDVQWEDQPALWIIFDVDDATCMYDAFGMVYQALLDALPHGMNFAISHHAVLFSWPTIHVLPLLRGKMIDRTGWRFATLVLIGDGENKEPSWSRFVRLPVPDSFLTQLGLTVWQSPRLDLALRLHAAAAQLLMVLEHMIHVKEMPEANGVGAAVLCAHAERQGKLTSDSLLEVADSLKVFARFLTDMGVEYIFKERPRVRIVIDILAEAREHLVPNDVVEGCTVLDTSQAESWAIRLQRVIPALDVMRLQWLTDVAEHD